MPTCVFRILVVGQTHFVNMKVHTYLRIRSYSNAIQRVFDQEYLTSVKIFLVGSCNIHFVAFYYFSYFYV